MNQCKVDIDQYMTELMSCKEQARIEKERADKVKIELIRYQKEVQEGIKERKQESMKEIESFNEEIDILKEELSMSAKDKFEIHKLYGYIEGHKNEIKTLTI